LLLPLFAAMIQPKLHEIYFIATKQSKEFESKERQNQTKTNQINEYETGNDHIYLMTPSA
jgi:hypothetical protein